MTGKQRPGWYFAHAQDALILRILHMFDRTFSMDAAQLGQSSKYIYTVYFSHKFNHGTVFTPEIRIDRLS